MSAEQPFAREEQRARLSSSFSLRRSRVLEAVGGRLSRVTHVEGQVLRQQDTEEWHVQQGLSRSEAQRTLFTVTLGTYRCLDRCSYTLYGCRLGTLARLYIWGFIFARLWFSFWAFVELFKCRNTCNQSLENTILAYVLVNGLNEVFTLSHSCRDVDPNKIVSAIISTSILLFGLTIWWNSGDCWNRPWKVTDPFTLYNAVDHYKAVHWIICMDPFVQSICLAILFLCPSFLLFDVDAPPPPARPEDVARLDRVLFDEALFNDVRLPKACAICMTDFDACVELTSNNAVDGDTATNKAGERGEVVCHNSSSSPADLGVRVAGENTLRSLDGWEVKPIARLPCNEAHCFHYTCIREWLLRSRSCPLCREEILQSRDRVTSELVVEMQGA